MIRSLFRGFCSLGLIVCVPAAVVLLVLLQPPWLALGRISDAQWKVLAVLGGLSIILFKLLQGLYYAKLDLELHADVVPRPTPEEVYVLIRLRVANVGSANVGIKFANLSIDGRQAGDTKVLGFDEVSCPNWITRTWWGPTRSYILVCGTTEYREVCVPLSPKEFYRIDVTVEVDRHLSVFPGTWRVSNIAFSDSVGRALSRATTTTG